MAEAEAPDEEQKERWLREANKLFDRQVRRPTPLVEWTERENARQKFADLLARKEEIDLAVRSAGACGVEFSPPAPFAGVPRPSPDSLAACALETGRGLYLSDSDASPAFAGVKSQAAYRELSASRRRWLDRFIAETGIVDDPEQKAARDVDREVLRDMTHEIAAALESQGVDAYRKGAWQCWRVGVHSLEVEAMPAFRNICVLPWVAARNRMRSVKALEWWLQCRTAFGRLVTFTNGPTCPVEEVGPRVRDLHRRISLLNSRPFMRRVGAEIVFRSTELGSMEKAPGDPEAGAIAADAAGRRLYHPHAHCVLHLRSGRIDKKEWSVLLKRIHSWWGHVWDEGGLIRNERELVKYITKPGEMARLAREDPAELAALARQLHGIHMVQCLGTLRAELAGHRADGEELEKQQTEDGPVWSWVRNPQHCFHSDSDETPWDRADGLDPEGVALGGGAGAYDNPADAPGQKKASRHLVKRYLAADRNGTAEPETARPAVCKVMTVRPPRSGRSCVREPQLIVVGTHFDVREILKDPIVEELWRATQDEYVAGLRLAEAAHTVEHYGEAYARAAADAGRQAGIRLDTGTKTVVPGPFPFWWDIPERRKPPDPAVWSPCPSPEPALTPLSRS